jgi:hypothetical protein
MRSRNILVIITLVIFCLPLFAQVPKSRKGIGFHMGTTTGIGYAMRWMNQKSGYQVTFGGYTFGNNEVYFADDYYDWDTEFGGEDQITMEQAGRESAINIGLNYLHMLDHFNNGRLYFMAGGSYKYYQQKFFTMDYQQTGENSADYDVIEGSKNEAYRIEHRWTVGGGPGFEFEIGNHFRFAAELPITYNWENDIVMWIPQAGIYYFFK